MTSLTSTSLSPTVSNQNTAEEPYNARYWGLVLIPLWFTIFALCCWAGLDIDARTRVYRRRERRELERRVRPPDWELYP